MPTLKEDNIKVKYIDINKFMTAIILGFEMYKIQR